MAVHTSVSPVRDGADTTWIGSITAPEAAFTANSSGSAANAGGGFTFLPNYTGATFNKSSGGSSG